MSAVGTPPDVMRTHMLRSTTPASNEKVLLYLESMKAAPPLDEDDPDRLSVRTSGSQKPPRSHMSGKSRSQLSRSQVSRQSRDFAGDAIAEGDELRSDIQEQSEVARTVNIESMGPMSPHDQVEREPGPNDLPGPRGNGKFVSGSSWGNKGPLPGVEPYPSHPLSAVQSNGQWSGHTPSRAAGVPLPETIASPTTVHNPFMEFGMAPYSGEAPWNGGPPPTNGGMLSPKSSARPMSPAKSQRTQYPPLPDSTMSPGHRTTTPSGMYERERRHTKTPSIAPSESASQVPRVRSASSKREKEPSVKPARSEAEVREGSGGSRGEKSRVDGSIPARSQAGLLSPRSQAPPMPMSPRSQASRGPPAASGIMSPARSQRTIPPSAIANAAAMYGINVEGPSDRTGDVTPTQSRPASPVHDLTKEEQRLLDNYFTGTGTLRPTATGNRTSYAPSAMAPSALEPEVMNSHFHDAELCQLLHALDQPMAEPVKKAVRKAVRARVKRLGMKYDSESIRQYRKSFHDHPPEVHLTPTPSVTAGPDPSALAAQLAATNLEEPPSWARNLLDNVAHLTAKVDQVDNKVDRVVELRSSRGGGSLTDSRYGRHHRQPDYAPSQSEMNQTMTQPPVDDDMYTEPDPHHLPTHHPGAQLQDEDDYYDDDEVGRATTQGDPDGDADISRGGLPSDYSPGQQYLEEELYKLRVKPHTGAASQSGATHKTWEVARDDGEEFRDGDTQAAVTESGLPEIPDTRTGDYTERSLPPIPGGGSSINGGQPHPDEQLLAAQVWPTPAYPTEQGPPPWQRIHQRLLSWAIVWPMSELENALNSTTRGHQVDEIALSIWSTQSYKRYVRSKMTESPPERVDRLFVPPNMAEAISTAVYNGRHGDACGMLRDLWAPFGLEGMPRLLIVLSKHRNDDNHWVVHRFSLPDGSLTTYDTYPDKSLPDGRPLGWWFAIRIAWPDAIYPNPERLMQKMVRLHRPMQLAIDNSVAAAGIWRNLLMGSRAERSLDLERLRDLINQEVKNLRQRKILGKLSIGSPRPNWEDMH